MRWSVVFTLMITLSACSGPHTQDGTEQLRDQLYDAITSSSIPPSYLLSYTYTSEYRESTKNTYNITIAGEDVVAYSASLRMMHANGSVDEHGAMFIRGATPACSIAREGMSTEGPCLHNDTGERIFTITALKDLTREFTSEMENISLQEHCYVGVQGLAPGTRRLTACVENGQLTAVTIRSSALGHVSQSTWRIKALP
jgi:hypothetical protein